MAVAVCIWSASPRLYLDRTAYGLLIRVVVLIDDVGWSPTMKTEETHDKVLCKLRASNSRTWPYVPDILNRDFRLFLYSVR